MSSFTSSDPSPTDDSAVSVLAAFARAGWSLNHLVRSDGHIACGECGEPTPAEEWDVQAQHRIEGASDPDDLQLAIGAACPRCDGKGALLMGYGPNASDDDGDVLVAVDLDDVSDPLAATS